MMVNESMLQLGSARSCIRELFEYGNLKKRELGEDSVFDFSIGNPSVPAPHDVEQAINTLMRELPATALHGYTSANGLEQTRAAIADDLNLRFNAGVTAQNLFITGGAAPAVIACLKALAAGEDSEFVVIAPYFPEYKIFVEASAGARLRVVPADTQRFQIDFDSLEAAIGANTRAVIVNSPNNPSGAVYSEQTIERLARLLEKKSAERGSPVFLLSDEPYRELVYSGVKVPFIPSYYSNTIMCYSYSKSLSLPGERIGYVLVPGCVQNSASVMNAVAGASRALGHVCAPSLMQRVIALCAGVRPDMSIYERNSILLYDNLSEMGYRCAKPEGAFYLFFEAPFGMTGKQFSDMARDAHNLLVVPGDDFGCPNHLRLSYCVPTRQIERALPVLAELYAIARERVKG